jgi:prevent-host-death family protein
MVHIMVPHRIASELAMSTLSANDLKTGGIAAIEAALAAQPEVIISVRGKERFVVMDVAHYHYLRECELEAALAQSQADLAAGRFVAESAQAHAARLGAMLVASESTPGQPKSAKKATPRRKG